MSETPAVATFEQLPRTLPIFPLTGALLLPGGRLPLHIFEPRYRQMTKDALGGHRIIGMIQPTESESGNNRPALYRIGCAGKIVASSETPDGRFFITLAGLCRFEMIEELATTTAYRQAVASYGRFRHDLQPAELGGFDRPRLLRSLRSYLDAQSIPADWSAIEAAPSDGLVNSLAMICPFSPSEKQALLEAPQIEERGRVLTALMEMTLAQPKALGDRQTPMN